MPKMNKKYFILYALAIWATDVCSRAARQLICIEPTGLRLRHIGKTDPQCGTVQFCFHSGRLTCSARTGFRAVTTRLICRKFHPRADVRIFTVTAKLFFSSIFCSEARGLCPPCRAVPCPAGDCCATDSDCDICTGAEEDVVRGRMPQDEPDAPLVGQQVDDGFVEVAVEADVGDLPDLDRTVLGRGRDHRVVVRAPLDVEHGGAVTRHQRSVAVYPTDLHRPTRQGVKLGGGPYQISDPAPLI